MHYSLMYIYTYISALTFNQEYVASKCTFIPDVLIYVDLWIPQFLIINSHSTCACQYTALPAGELHQTICAMDLSICPFVCLSIDTYDTPPGIPRTQSKTPGPHKHKLGILITSYTPYPINLLTNKSAIMVQRSCGLFKA